MKRILYSSLVMLVLSLLMLPAGAFTLTGTTPDRGVNTGMVFTNLTGADLPGSASTRLVMSGGPNITGQFITVGSPSWITCVFDLGGKTAGAYDVVVVNNTDGTEAVLPEGFSILNPSPSLSGITPEAGINTGTIEITRLSGSNFLPDASVTLAMSGEPNITATNVQLVNPSTITCSFDLAGVEPGDWDVVLTNYDGQEAVMIGAFAISYPPPLVASITPASGKNNEVIGITNLAGSNFMPGATVALTRNGQADIPTINSPIVNPDKILCFFNLTGSQGGAWNVVVTNPDGQFSSLDEGFSLFYPTPPVMTEIAPSTGENTGPPLVASITGNSFQQGLTLALKKSGHPDIPGFDIDVASQSQIVAEFDLAGAVTGAWDIVVTNNDGQSSVLPGGFAITNPAPKLTAIVPISGLNNGPVAINNLSGANFLPGATVTFSRTGSPDIEAVPATVETSKKITCTVDFTGAAAGLWNVSVMNPDGQEAVLPDAFTVANPPPSLSGMMPGSGVIGGTLPATIEGANFIAGCVATLTKTGEPDIALPVTTTTPTALACSINLTGAAPGLWDLRIENPDGQTITLYHAFIAQYPAPTVTSIVPDTGDNSGITGILVLKGTGFFDDAMVRMVKTGEPEIKAKGTPVIENETTIICFFDLTGAQAGTWDIQVMNTDGQNGTLPAGFFIKYPAPPQITAITPSSGINSGTTAVTDLSGAGFHIGAVAVLKKTGQTDIPASNVTVISPIKITCDLNLSGKATGPWDVVVINNDGQQDILPSGFQVTNPAPTVNSVTPVSGLNSGPVEVANLAGSYFLPGAMVKLAKLGEPDIIATGTTVVNPGKITCTFNLAGVKTGLWNIVVRNPDGQNGILANSFTVENPAPTVTSIAPNKGSNNGPVEISGIDGTGFLAGASVQLTRTGQSPITATNVSVMSPEMINCTFDLTGKASGSWTVVVTNPDGKSGSLPSGMTAAAARSAALPSGFEITPPPPVPDFEATPTQGTAPLTVQFTDLSSNSPFLWAWNFGDGTTTVGFDQKNPIHTYQSPGIYNVILQATNNGGSAQIVKKSYIIIVSTPIANFSADPVEGTAPLLVHFTDTSDGHPTKWLWKFGDGGYSSEKNPYFLYQAPGTYTVTLTVYNNAGSDTVTRQNLITVTSVPVAGFTANRTSGASPLTVQFTDTSTGGSTSWDWTFGNDGGSHEQNPVHVFQNPGTYSVKLVVSNNAGNSTEVKDGYIMVGQPLSANFTYSTSNPAATAPLTVAFTDRSTGDPTIWSWRFGDGYVTNEKNPIHTYTQPGSYVVTLTVTSLSGSDTLTKTIVVKSPLKADFFAEPTTGSDPLTILLTDTSIGTPVQRYWVISKGVDVVLLNPGEQKQLYTLNEPGLYTVLLHIQDQAGSVSELEKKDYINVLPFPPA
jgi:PKD repeat protein